MARIHTELAFEEVVEQALLQQGYTAQPPSAYHKEHALLPEVFIGFLQRSQPEKWRKYRGLLNGKSEELLLKEVGRIRRDLGTLHLLRNGLEVYGVKFNACYFKPAHGINPDNLALYASNELSVVRQVRFSHESQHSLDLLLCINGIPIVTVELKNPLTGQTFADAQRQYAYTRPPSNPLFAFRSGALVHFTVDPDEAYMTTQLAGEATRWLPFNRGNPDSPDKASGNPPGPKDKYRTYYLWEEVWAPDSLLDLVGTYMHDERPKAKSKEGPGKLLFPRYHQLDVVRKLMTHAKAHGTGQRYLIQHSAGSGKTNSIAWLAYHLVSLHTEDDKKVFDGVVVISDRRVLDKQLQDAIYGLDHTPGMVQVIDKDSKQLRKALKEGVPIIVTTLQKFPFVVEEVGNLAGRTYGVIIDEAHSSQGSQASNTLVETLGGNTEDEPDGEDLVNHYLEEAGPFKGKAPGVSFFAFTATPKPKTLNLFGEPDELGDGRKPFHSYTMRQAIDEGFILDVLLNYTTYESYLKLAKAIDEDPELMTRSANKALRRFAQLHQYHLGQKAEVIIEHFQNAVRKKIGGKAKAMVVASSRLHALRYYRALEKYAKQQGYQHELGILVAFSGELNDPETGERVSEVSINGIGEKELPDKFAKEDKHILVVADKYQTGFDQPLLHTMYLDKQISGVQAVQTLSRLNRTAPGKEDTFVLDFVNRREDILEAFQTFYERTDLDEITDPQKLYELRDTVMAYGILVDSEMQQAYQLLTAAKKDKLTKADHQKLEYYLQPAIDRFRALDEAEQDAFRKSLRAYVNLYGWMWQLLVFESEALDTLHLYGKYLMRRLPKRQLGEQLNLDDEVALEYFRLVKKDEGSLKLEAGAGKRLEGPTATGTGAIKDKREPLQQIIDALNERLGDTIFTEADRLLLNQVYLDHVNDAELREQALANPKENFRFGFEKKFEEALINRHETNAKTIERLFDSSELKTMVFEKMLDYLYREFKKSA